MDKFEEKELKKKGQLEILGMTVCCYHVTYVCQSESTLYSFLNFKAQNRRNI